MRRGIVLTILIFVFFIIQCTVIPYISLAGVMPNLLIILVSSTAFFRGSKTGLLTGFFCGLLNDLFFGSVLGFYAMIYMCIGYLCGFLNKEFFDFDLRLPMLIIAVSDFLYGMIVYLCMFLMRNRLDIGYYLLHVMIPEIIYTMAAAVIVYRLLYTINQKLTLIEKRRDGYFD